MAYYAALVSLMQSLDDIILHNRYPNFLLDKQPFIKSLHEKFSSLVESLQDYSSNGDEAADRMEARIRHVAHRVQDVIETGISHQIRVDSKWSIYDLIIACKCLFCRRDLDLVQVEQEVDSILEDLLVMKKENHGNEHLQANDCFVDAGTLEQISMGINTMVGFDEQLIAIKDQLCGNSSQLQIIPIVGMGGIGKTTLARHAFNDSLILYHFYCRAWTSISQNFSVKSVLQMILKSMCIETDDLGGEEEEMLKERIYKSLKGQRYLIVIDDVWSTKTWDDLMFIFPNDSNGSRILLTTRLVDVANHVASSDFIHEMKFLNVNASWNLLRQKVFARKNCPLELEDIGKYIARECRGLPLAIVVIAGVLLAVQTPQYWDKVARNVGSILSKDDKNLSNILSLSFNHLSHQLKACFLYMGCFPEDYLINISRLTWLWNAEGLLKSIDGSKTFEQVAEECLGDLVRRNLVIITKKRANGEFKYCIMHDFVRNFCRERALHEYFFHGKHWERHLPMHRIENLRRIVPYSYTGDPWAFGSMFSQPSAFCTCNPVRSILWFERSDIEETYVLEWGGFKLMKVLDIAFVRRHVTPFQVSQMFLLKYLALHLDGVDKNDPLYSILKLPNLETLIIYGPRSLPMSLPSNFWQMQRLRHLIIVKTKLAPIPMHSGVSFWKLEYLQTLETIEAFTFTIEAVAMITNLRKLKIRYEEIEASDMWKQHGLTNLVHLHRLEELKITFTIFQFPIVKSFRSSFVLPQNLKKLSLSGCRFSWKDLTKAGSLPCLLVLRLRDNALMGEEWEPIEGEFLQLKFLLMKGLDVKYWRADSAHFPCLEHLKIDCCSKLVKIPLEIGDIPTLKSIHVYDSYLAGDSAKLILEEQQSNGNDTLQVLVRDWSLTIL